MPETKPAADRPHGECEFKAPLRANGHDYGPIPIQCVADGGRLYVVLYQETVQVNFCPICGRKAAEQVDA